MSNKKYVINDYVFYFNVIKFNEIFNKKCKKMDMKIGEYENLLADKLCLSSSTIHFWKINKSSPCDLEMIKELAKTLDLNDYKILLQKGMEERKLSDLKIFSIRNIYISIIDYLNYFEKTSGYNDLWFDLTEDPKHREGCLYDIALEEHNKVINSFKKEYPVLHNEKVYEELSNLIYNDLYELFDGKLSYGYRYEAGTDGILSASEEVENFQIKLDQLINKYCE